MKIKQSKKTVGLLLMVLIMCLVSTVLFNGGRVYADGEVNGSITDDFNIAAFPVGISAMTKVFGQTADVSGSIFEANTFTEKEIEGTTAAAFPVHYYNIVRSSNAIMIEEPIIKAVNSVANVSLRIYAHLSSPNNWYRQIGGDRGICLYSLDTTESIAGGGVFIPANVVQDEWTDFTLTYSQFSRLCDADGVFRGIKTALWIRSGQPAGDHVNVYMDNTGYLAIKSITYTEEVTQLMTNITVEDFPEGVTAMTTIFGRNGEVSGSKFNTAVFADATVGGMTAASFPVDSYNIVRSSNYLMLNEPIVNAAATLASLRIKLYAHISSPNTWYRQVGGDRGIFLFSLDCLSAAGGEGVPIPANITQDRWTDFELTSTQIAELCDADGTLRGIRLGLWIRSGGTDNPPDMNVYLNNSGYIAIGDILYNEKAEQDELVLSGKTNAKYGEMVALSLSGGSGTGEVSYEVSGDNIFEVEGSRLTFTGVGTVTVKALKAANSNYKEAESNTVTIIVTKVTDNAIVWKTALSDKAYDGNAIDCEAEAAFGTIAYQFYAWDFTENDWDTTALVCAPSVRGKYKVITMVAETDNYNGDTNTTEFYITAAVNVTDVSYTGSTKAGETITFTAINVPTGKLLDYFEIKIGGGEFAKLDGNTYIMANNDIEIRAVFKTANYIITLNNGVSYSGIVQYGEIISLTAVDAPIGKSFDYFTVNGDKLPADTFTMPANDITVGAVYKSIIYTVTAGDGVTYSGTSEYGQTITLMSGTAPKGKEFNYFTVDGEKIDGNTFIMPADNVSVTVVWKDAGKEDGCKSSANGNMAVVSIVLLALAATLLFRKV